MRVVHEPARDRELAAILTTFLNEVRALSGDQRRILARECERTVAERAVAVAVLTDTLQATRGWRYRDILVRHPRSVQLLGRTTSGEEAVGLSTVEKVAVVDAMVAVIWQTFAEQLGSRLVTTLTGPFRAVGIAL